LNAEQELVDELKEGVIKLGAWRKANRQTLDSVIDRTCECRQEVILED
jgi:hypothetical protein